MTAIIVLLSCLLAATIIGTVVSILKYRKISKTADNVNSFAMEGKEVMNKVGKDVDQIKQTTDNVNSLVNDGRKAADEIGSKLSEVRQTFEDAMSNLDNIAVNKKEISK